MATPSRKLGIEDARDVLDALTSISSKWEVIGLQIGVRPDVLDGFKQQYGQNPKDCLLAVLKEHLKKLIPEPSWDGFVRALRSDSVGETALAEILATKFCPTQQTESQEQIQADGALVALPKVRIGSTDGAAASHTPGPASGNSKAIASPDSMQQNQFPYLKLPAEMSEDARETFYGRLSSDNREIQRKFQCLVSSTMDSLAERNITPKQLSSKLMCFQTYEPQIGTSKKLLLDCHEEIRTSETVDDAFFIMRNYYSFFNYELIQHIIQEFGLDRNSLSNYEKELKMFCERRVYEFPQGDYGTLNNADSKLILHLDSEFEKFTMISLRNFRHRLCQILEVSCSEVRLVEVKQACVELVFAISSSLIDKILPLSEEQKKSLQDEGVKSFVVQNLLQAKTAQPVEQLTEPAEPVQQLTEPAEPVQQLTEPVRQLTEPVQQLTEPAEPVEQLTEPAEPVEQLTEPAEPVEQLTKPAEPAQKLTEPAEPVEQLTKPAEPVQQLTEPAEPVEQLTKPAQPVQQLTEPLEQLTNIVTEQAQQLTRQTEGQLGYPRSKRSAATDSEIHVLQRILLLAIHNGYTQAIQDSMHILPQDDQFHEALDYIAEWGEMTEQGYHKFQYSPLMLACYDNKVNIVKLLLDKNTSVHFKKKDKGGLNALHVACFNGSLDIVTLLIEKSKTQIHRKFQKPCLDVAVNSRTTKDGLTPLMYAVRSKNENSIEIVKCLLETGVIDLKQTNKKKQNVFHIAAHEQKLACLVELHSNLPESEANPLLAVDKRGWGVLHHAAGGTGERNCDVLEWLFDQIPALKSPELLNQKTETGSTPLLVACEYQKVAAVKMLVKVPGVDVSALTNDMEKGLKNGLHIAAIHDSLEIAEVLINKKCSLMQQDSEGDTPLHIAQKKASFNVLDLFRKTCTNEGENVELLKNKDGLTVNDIKPVDDVIPAEIRKGGEKDIEIYKEALKKGKRQILLCNLLLLGQERVGKTSLYHLLVGKAFMPDLDPTRGIENKVIDFVDDRYISAQFHELTDKKQMQENDALFEDSLVEEFNKSKGASLPVGQKAQSVTENDLISQIHSIKAGIQKRLDEQKHRVAAEKEMRQKDFPPIAVSPGHSRLKYGLVPRTISKGESIALKPIAVPSRKPEQEKPKPQPPPSQLEQTAITISRKAKVKAPVKKDDQGERSEQPAKEVKPKLLEETDGDKLSAISGLLFSPRQSTSISKKLKSPRKKTKEPKLRLNALDFAGQPEYRPMHHCFITRRAIYVVVFNLQEVANYLELQCSEEINKRKINNPFEEMRYWLNSISAHVCQQPGDEDMKSMKRLLLVGTHKSPKNCTPISEEMHKRINKELTELFFEDKKTSRCVNHLHFMPNDDIFAAVENSFDGVEEKEREKSGAKALQDQLHKIANKLPFLQDSYPIVWLSFEKRLMRLRADLEWRKQSAIVKLARVEELAHQCKIEEPKEIDLALKFFHDVGKISCLKRLPTLFLNHAEQVELASLVLLNPKWLIKIMKQVMELAKSRSDIPGTLISEFTTTGTASVELLKACWAGCLDDISFEQLCLILKAYGLIYPMEIASCSILGRRSASEPLVSTSEGKHSPSETANPESESFSRSKSEESRAGPADPPTAYLIPCKLPPTEKDEMNTLPKRAVSFYFDFLGFLPDEVFQRLICLMLARSQAEPLNARAKKMKIPRFTRTRCQFYFNDCLWEIEQEIPRSVLRVSVLSFSKSETNPSAWLKAIHEEFLYRICKDSGLEGLTYYGGPMTECKCGWSGILHMLEYPNEETATEGICDRCRESIDIDQRPITKSGPSDSSLSLKNVRQALWPARSKWRDIAIEVDLDSTMLPSIANENREDGDRLTAVLTEWLKKINPEPSWEVLASALRQPPVNFPQIALKIEQDHGINVASSSN